MDYEEGKIERDNRCPEAQNKWFHLNQRNGTMWMKVTQKARHSGGYWTEKESENKKNLWKRQCEGRYFSY